MTSLPRRYRHEGKRAVRGPAVLGALTLVVLVGCSDGAAPTAVPRATPVLLGKAVSGPSVASTSPSYAHRDTTLDVRVLGSGFTTGALAEWSLAGVTDPTKIRTNHTQFVSSSELVVNVTISANADLALWDVTVTLTGGKKGVGTELFEVTTATVLGGASGIGGYVMATSDPINGDEVSVVGYGALSGAWAYDASAGRFIDLGAGQAWAIDPTGTTALGRDGNGNAVAWNRVAPGIWVRELLPNPQAAGNVSSVALAPDGSLLAGGWVNVSVKKSQNLVAPVVWRRVGGVWQAPVTYATPGASSAIYGISPSGVAVGKAPLGGGAWSAIVWDNATTYSLIDGLTAYGVNPAGSIVVGDRNGTAGIWWRDATGSWTYNGSTLPTVGGSCTTGRALAVTTDGVVVGQSCVSSSRTSATVWQLDVSSSTPTLLGFMSLGNLGPGATNSGATAVTSSAPHIVVGSVGNGSHTIVRWLLP